MSISDIIKGSKEFQNQTYLDHKENFIDLIDNGQKPKVLFIGCSDSRVVPNLITNSGPGDLFIIRNIGNFVPPHDVDFPSTPAAIEYAVSALEVDTILICAHSQCGAIRSLYQDLDAPEFKHVKRWLSLGQKAKNIIDLTDKSETLDEKFHNLEKVSAIFQAENLLTYPSIKERVEAGKLEIRVWHYSIRDGKIEEYDKNVAQFIPLEK